MFHKKPTVLLAAALGTLLASRAVAQSAPAPARDEVVPSCSDLKPQGKPIVVAGLAHLELAITGGLLRATVHGASPGFVGVVLLSSSPDVTQLACGLPPLLSDFVLLGGGYTASQDLEFKAPSLMPDWAQVLYGQALLLDEHGIWVSGLVPIANPSWVRETNVDASDA